ncbi:hypothetical protein BsWGS_25390 [Bradybaena similaris]
MAAAYPDCEESEDSEDYDDSEQSRSNVTTARSFRQARGIFEAEINCVEEVNLHKHVCCEKNPDHIGFIPPDKFTVKDLPHRYQDGDIVALIKALAQITVLVRVKFTSPGRPDYYPNSNKPYPAAEYKGTKRLRTGSGWVWRVSIHSKSDIRQTRGKKRQRKRNSGKTCPCQDCKRSWNPREQWAFIEIYTATHMIFDEREGAETTCHFFYDSDDIFLDSASVKSLRGAIRVHNEVDGDACRMTYVTHDIRFAYDLQTKWKEYKSLHTEVGEKYNTNNNEDENAHKLTIIVSHPHGCSKQISIGKYVKRDEMDYNNAYAKYTYTTPTCPGCSGGPVYVLSRWWWWGCDHPHGGQCEDNANLNYSGIAMY